MKQLSDEASVKALFITVGFEVMKIWKLQNKYWGDSHLDVSFANPWWLVKTDFGLIEIGPRKRVISIDWSDTTCRDIITEDEVTKDETMVHAWTEAKMIEYLLALRSIRPHVLDSELDRNNWR